ncbi:serine hydrolase domain-containing protein [Bosea sp. NPDC003192]|jgi:CubicO group peptidase (beta-lactamase class C family)|uniref:serine hydrolase domain-containing protein n=1 Tax=Bosea sp. NPDC003192 TaxID=3390551 RepID=UPI003D091130
MTHTQARLFSRRKVLAGLAAAATPNLTWAQTIAMEGPVFSATGPDAGRYGIEEGFPAHRAPYEPRYRVGTFSRFDQLYPTRWIERPATPWNFKRASASVRYTYMGKHLSLNDYVSGNPVTGLLVAKDDEILFEHYQYARTDHDRLASQSMAKSLVALLIGIAQSEGAIRAVDDTVETYVPALAGSEYGKTPIRDLLHMSSGVEFGEQADNERDLDRLWLDLMGGYVPSYASQAKGTIGGIRQFNHRVAPAGSRFFYASIEADVLGLVLRQATGQTLSSYLQEKIWKPIGAEADSCWLVDAQGFEVAHGFFNAVLRDYARLGRLLAHDGAWNGKQIIPAQWMMDATTVRPSDSYLAPAKADPTFGYGYLMWLLPWGARQFALFGDYGHRICVDPTSKLVLVQTAVEQTNEIWSLWPALVKQLGRA